MVHLGRHTPCQRLNGSQKARGNPLPAERTGWRLELGNHRVDLLHLRVCDTRRVLVLLPQKKVITFPRIGVKVAPARHRRLDEVATAPSVERLQ